LKYSYRVPSDIVAIILRLLDELLHSYFIGHIRSHYDHYKLMTSNEIIEEQDYILRYYLRNNGFLVLETIYHPHGFWTKNEIGVYCDLKLTTPGYSSHIEPVLEPLHKDDKVLLRERGSKISFAMGFPIKIGMGISKLPITKQRVSYLALFKRV